MGKVCINDACEKLKSVQGEPICQVDGVPPRFYRNRGQCVLEMSSYQKKKAKASFYDMPDAFINEYYDGKME